MLDWDDLRFYLVAAQAGTVTAAAEILRVSRTTVTRRIESLERSLRASLYERSAAGAGSTDAGRLVLACARDVESRIAELLADLSATGPKPTSIRVSIPADLGLDVADLAVAMQGCIPNATFEFVHTARPEMDLHNRRSLIGLCIAENVPPYMNGRNLASLTQRAYRSAAIAQTSIGSTPWLTWGHDLAHMDSARWIETHIDKIEIEMRVNSAVDMMKIVRRGLGIGYLWDQFTDGDDLLPAELGVPVFEAKLWLCMHEDVPPNPIALEALRLIGDYVKSRT